VRRFDEPQRPVLCQHTGDRLAFRTARRRAGSGDAGDLVQNDRDIFDEDRVGAIVGRSNLPNRTAECTQRLFVGAMLRDSQRDVDHCPRQMRQLAALEAARDGASKCDSHRSKGEREKTISTGGWRKTTK
jgi:hypothetical protein